MITKEICYGMKCDRCGKLYGDDDTHIFSEEEELKERANDNEWVLFSHKHYCPDCVEWDSQCNYKVKPPIPSHVAAVKNYMKHVADAFVVVKEYKTIFSVEGYTDNGEDILPEIHSKWIEEYLGENLLGIHYDYQEHTSNAMFRIKIKNNYDQI